MKRSSSTVSSLSRRASVTSLPPWEELPFDLTAVRELYLAKCQDLNLAPSDGREDRFIDFFRRKAAAADVLELRQAGLGARSAAALATFFANDSHFNALDLAGNSLRDKGAQAIAKMIPHNRALESLNLQSNDIGPDGASALFNALMKASDTTSITSIDLSGLSGVNRNHIGTRGATAIAAALAAETPLELDWLALGSNGVGVDGAQALAPGLAVATSLKYLDVSSNNLTAEGAKVILEALRTATGLTELKMTHNALDEDGGKVVGVALKEKSVKVNVSVESESLSPLPCLKSLDVGWNNIGPGGGHLIGLALRGNTQLTTLNLDSNRLGNKGVHTLALALRDHPTLAVLVLRNNLIAGKGGTDLGDALRKNRSLHKLDLYNNSLGDEGASAFAGALRVNSTLTHLDLGNCKIGNDGGMALGGALRANVTVQVLSLKSNFLRTEAGDVLASAVSKNTSLLTLDVSYNDVSFPAFTSIERRLKANNVTYKENTVARAEAEIAELRKDSEALQQTQMLIRRESESKLTKESTAKEMEAVYEKAEKSKEMRIADLEDQLGNMVKLRKECEGKTTEKSAQVTRTRYQRDVEYRAAIAKAQRETDDRILLERELRHAIKEVDDFRALAKGELGTLEGELNLAQNEERVAEQDLELAQHRLKEFMRKWGHLVPESYFVKPGSKGTEEPEASAKAPKNPGGTLKRAKSSGKLKRMSSTKSLKSLGRSASTKSLTRRASTKSLTRQNTSGGLEKEVRDLLGRVQLDKALRADAEEASGGGDGSLARSMGTASTPVLPRIGSTTSLTSKKKKTKGPLKSTSSGSTSSLARSYSTSTMSTSAKTGGASGAKRLVRSGSSTRSLVRASSSKSLGRAN